MTRDDKYVMSESALLEEADEIVAICEAENGENPGPIDSEEAITELAEEIETNTVPSTEADKQTEYNCHF